MNYIFRIIIFVLFINTCFSQYKREVNIKSSIDTTQTEFRTIFNLWENYINDLNYRNANNNFLLKEFDEKLNSYWYKCEVDNYKLCDLTFSFMSGYGNVMYPLYKEYFLGFVKRDSNMYEIKTMFISPFKENPHDFPTLMMTVMVIKTGDSFKLCNKFTLNRSKLLTKKFANITYYYPPFYKFNDSLATTLSNRIDAFVKNFNIINQEPLTYLVSNNITEISTWFGIDYFEWDYMGGENMIEGRAIHSNNMILSGGGGENYMHEIIHILLNNVNTNKNKGDSWFEEGICCFFGEHVGHDYSYHAKRLKEYLNANKQIDLSQNLLGYYSNSISKFSYKKDSIVNPMDYIFYCDFQTNYMYIIQAVLCDIAFKQGGYQKVKNIYIQQRQQVPDEDYQKFYTVIEKELGIKRKNVDKHIREYLNKNY